ncbi:MAG: DUF3820 family protein [Flavobacteriaceae bacterium]
MEVDKAHLIELANYKMPYGKYKGEYLVNIPEYYFAWFAKKGFPEGKLGTLMKEMHEIKINGLEGLLKTLIKKS